MRGEIIVAVRLRRKEVMKGKGTIMKSKAK